MAFRVVAVDPVEDVQPTVDSEREEIMTGDVFRLASLGDHEELRQDGTGFEVDGKRPRNLRKTGETD